MKKNKHKKILSALLIAITLTVGIILGLWQVKPPRLDESSPDYPVYQRMMSNIERLASEPHPSGSAEIERVRAELIAEIKAMGLTPIVEDVSFTPSELAEIFLWIDGASSVEQWWFWHEEWVRERHNIHSADDWFEYMVKHQGADTLQNILVKLDAPNTDRGIMFVAHYDSVPNAPGAADAMVGVCALLEVMRAHAQNGALKNDIYFLLTDGEENGLLGAKKFVEAHPELKDKIDMVVNLEARGNRGGLILFETSPKSYNQMKTVVRSGAKPIGTSWAAEIYAMMPNWTDFTVFLNHGYQGVNFAAIEGVEHYHMPTDNYENLDRNTAWQYLQTTLALTDYAANHSLDGLREPSQDAVYFPLLPGVLVLMTAWVSHIICAVSCVLTLIFGWIQIKQRRLKISFTTVLMGLLLLLSIGSAIWFAAGAYLFYIPLLAMTVTLFMKKWTITHIAAKMVSGIITLLLWVPVVFLLWVSMVQPMML